MSKFLLELEEKIGDRLFLSPSNIVKLGVFSSVATLYRILKEKELPHFKQRTAIRIYSKDLLAYLEKNFHSGAKEDQKEEKPAKVGV